jgi:SNF2 family DNA or RNA helicase
VLTPCLATQALSSIPVWCDDGAGGQRPCPRFGLTGTPMQNDLRELWATFNWAVPGCLGEWTQFQD